MTSVAAKTPSTTRSPATTPFERTPAAYCLRNTFEANAIAQVCAAHAPETVWSIERCDPDYGIASLTFSGRTFNLQTLGALLRIADELDNSFVRVSGLLDQQESVRHVIRDINPVPQKGIIEIHSEPRTWSDWEHLLAIRDIAQKRLREVSKCLERIGLFYYQVWLRPVEFSSTIQLPQPVTLYHDLVTNVGALVEPRFDSVDLLVEMDGCEISILCTNTTLDLTTPYSTPHVADHDDRASVRIPRCADSLAQQEAYTYGHGNHSTACI